MQDHIKEADIIKKLFKGIWTLEDLEKPDAVIHEIVKKAIANPHDYVIKP